MKTRVILRALPPNDECTVRFSSHNAPPLLIGDTFQLPIMDNLGVATVKKRNWHGQELVILCDASHFLVNNLIKSATKMNCRVDDYELPSLDWSYPDDA